MEQRRKYARFKVDLPITCTVVDPRHYRTLSTPGQVQDLCLKGMKVHLPGGLIVRETAAIHYVLDLPKPYTRIKGNGKIRWTHWDEKKDYTLFGMETYFWSHAHRAHLEALLRELAESSSKSKDPM